MTIAIADSDPPDPPFHPRSTLLLTSNTLEQVDVHKNHLLPLFCNRHPPSTQTYDGNVVAPANDRRRSYAPIQHLHRIQQPPNPINGSHSQLPAQMFSQTTPTTRKHYSRVFDVCVLQTSSLRYRRHRIDTILPQYSPAFEACAHRP